MPATFSLPYFNTSSPIRWHFLHAAVPQKTFTHASSFGAVPAKRIQDLISDIFLKRPEL